MNIRTLILVAASSVLVGCAYSGGQVGSNAAYEYEKTADGGCKVQNS